jgi:hypothetical protein
MAGLFATTYQKTIVVLAASRKPGGRCIAGKEVAQPVPGAGPGAISGAWIRPVSVRPGAEIDVKERRLMNGSEPRLLDIVRIPMLAPAPRLHQTENHTINARFYWQKVGLFSWKDIESLMDAPETLWTNCSSTRIGVNDRVSETQIAGITSSLYLIKPTRVVLQVLTPHTAFAEPQRRVRAEFRYRGVHYNIPVTDPDAETTYLSRQDGYYPLTQDAYFCMSLAESAVDGHYYKLVASILTNEAL